MERIALQSEIQGKAGGDPSFSGTINNIPYTRNVHFTGRDALLGALHATLQATPYVQLTESKGGIGGAGKTQAALEYCYRHQADYEVIWWMYGERNSQIAATYAQLARRLQLFGEEEGTQREEMEALRHWLNEHENWLLVIDGVEQPYDLTRFLPDNRSGNLLLTSRHAQPSLPMTVLPVSHFSPEDSSDFLQRLSGQAPDEAMASLANGLGHLPLTLSLAGAYCRGAGVSFQEFNRRLQVQIGKLNRPQMDTRLLLAAVLLNHFDHLSSTDLASLDLAAFCAYLSPEDISIHFLRGAAEKLPSRLSQRLSTDQGVNTLITALHSFGLVSLHEGSLETHPLIQVVTRELMNQEQRHTWATAALRATEFAFPVEDAYTHAIPGCTRLLGHALTAAYHAGSYEIEDETTSALLNQVGLYLYGCNEPVEAQVCYERSIALARKKHGDNHPVVAARINNLGVVHQSNGRLKDARRCYEKAFAIIESVYGQARKDFYNPNDESMLTLPVYNLCNVLLEMKDLSGARTAYSRAIPIFQNVYSWNHPLVSESLNSVGKIWQAEGRLPKALKCFESAIMSEENTENPDTARLTQYLNNMTLVLLDMDKAIDAQTHAERSLALSRDYRGTAHTDLLRDLMTLGRVFRAQDRNMEAREHFQEALSICGALESQESTQTAKVHSFLGRASQLCEEFDEAKEHFQHACRINTHLNGPDCEVLISDYINLGRLHADTEAFEEAVEHFERALALDARYQVLSQDLLATVLNRLGRALQGFDRHGDALLHFQRAYEIDRTRYGDYHGNVARDAYYVGSAQAHLGDRVKAVANLMQSLESYERLIGKKHPKVQRIRKKIDQINRRQTAD